MTSATDTEKSTIQSWDIPEYLTEYIRPAKLIYGACNASIPSDRLPWAHSPSEFFKVKYRSKDRETGEEADNVEIWSNGLRRELYMIWRQEKEEGVRKKRKGLDSESIVDGILTKSDDDKDEGECSAEGIEEREQKAHRLDPWPTVTFPTRRKTRDERGEGSLCPFRYNDDGHVNVSTKTDMATGSDSPLGETRTVDQLHGNRANQLREGENPDDKSGNTDYHSTEANGVSNVQNANECRSAMKKECSPKEVAGLTNPERPSVAMSSVASSDAKESSSQQDAQDEEEGALGCNEVASTELDPTREFVDQNILQPPTPFISTRKFDVPKLEEFIPQEYFPTKLIVHDPRGLISPHEKDFDQDENEAYFREKVANSKSALRVYYRKSPNFKEVRKMRASRITFPTLQEVDEAETVRSNVAFLNLEDAPVLGVGHHSVVYGANLRLPVPLTVPTESGEVRVAAKLAFARSSQRGYLSQESSIYSTAPRALFESWCGYEIVPPLECPVPVGPVMPKFYGYYVPESTMCLEGCEEPEGRTCNRHRSPSCILLMEDCGVQVDPSLFELDERVECQSLIHRLHKHEIVQGSCFKRNFVAQPGPLTHPPSRRTLSTPSFRMIDFGKASTRNSVRRRCGLSLNGGLLGRDEWEWEEWVTKNKNEEEMWKRMIKQDLDDAEHSLGDL